jgi:hypothetical protein
LAHPNCPIELWWHLATRHPFEAQNSVLFDLMTMEAPERWEKLERAELEWGIRDYSQKLPLASIFLLAADYAEHVLPAWERRYPDNQAPRHAISLTRQLAHGEVAEDSPSLKQARQAVRQAYFRAETESAIDYSSGFAADAARQALVGTNDAAWKASTSAAKAAANQWGERKWQWRRLCDYLRGTP